MATKKIQSCDSSVNGTQFFCSFMRQQIDLMLSANRLGTARNYSKALNSFSAFLQGKEVCFSMVTEPLIENYSGWLVRRGVVRNSISFYMRILRAVYNKGVRQKLADPAHPFYAVYTGIDQTIKRAIPEHLMARLYNLEISRNPALDMVRDIFIFSYCMRGMAFVDVAYLRKRDIQGGLIRYHRRKTGQLLCVRMEEDMKKIIDKYLSDEREYVFPIISSDDARESYGQYRRALNNYNRRLKELSGMLGSDCHLTSYVARHSWATAARHRNVPISVISAGLGHTSESTTQIYLSMIENTAIDDANKKIIEGLKL